MTADQVEIRRGLYADSVTLMQISKEVSQSDDVTSVQVAMATELNLEVLTGLGFVIPKTDSANDLLIAVRAVDSDAAGAAVLHAERLLTAPRRSAGGSTAALPPRTFASAAAAAGPGLALISVPGRHAFTEAMDALESGCDVLIFSDNVTVEHEIALKDYAAEHDLLVLGPDCGTAVVGGVGLGFSHTLDRGPVGLVAASGTGAQQVLCLLDAAGVGVSAALGVGGRDLSEAVAARSTVAALALLEADPATELIIVVSKPPAAAVAEQVRAFTTGLSTPVQFALLGKGEPDLTVAVEQALGALGVQLPTWPSWIAATEPGPGEPGAGVSRTGVPHSGVLRGLFCGGTLCDEAMLIASAELGAIRSNIALQPDWALDSSLTSADHTMIDFGDDALTQGRAHPMIDPSLRTQHLQSALADPRTGVVLLDVVLGHGAHPDPVAELLPVLVEAEVPIVVSLIGARQDPQNLDSAAQRLHDAGASVFTSNAAAARHAVSLIQQGETR
jgi:FdrA protein